MCVGVSAGVLNSAFARVALINQHATRMRRIACGQIFQHHLTKDTIFRKKDTDHRMYVLSFSTTFMLNISHSKKNSKRYCHKCENVFM